MLSINHKFIFLLRSLTQPKA